MVSNWAAHWADSMAAWMAGQLAALRAENSVEQTVGPTVHMSAGPWVLVSADSTAVSLVEHWAERSAGWSDFLTVRRSVGHWAALKAAQRGSMSAGLWA